MCGIFEWFQHAFLLKIPSMLRFVQHETSRPGPFDFSGRPWMFLPRKSVREAQKKAFAANGPSLGRPERVVRNVNGETRESRDHWSHWNFEDFLWFGSLILWFWFGLWRGWVSGIDDRRGPQTTGSGCRDPPMKSLKHDDRWKIHHGWRCLSYWKWGFAHMSCDRFHSGVSTFGKVFLFQSNRLDFQYLSRLLICQRLFSV